MLTLRKIAERIGVPIEEALEILEILKFKNVNPDDEIKDLTRALVFDRALSHYMESPVIIKSSSPKKRGEVSQQMVLSRDFVIFTYAGLRKTPCLNILTQAVSLKKESALNNKIIATSSAIDALYKAAENDTSVEPIVKLISELKESGELHILECGGLAYEAYTIADFIQNNTSTASVVVIGILYPLHTFIEQRNAKNKKNKSFTLVFEKDITSSGHLTNIDNSFSVFREATKTEAVPMEPVPIIDKDDIPTVGSTLFFEYKGNRSSLVLGERIGGGGEATLYSALGGAKCAKILNSRSLTPLKIEKIKIMCSKLDYLRKSNPALMERIAWPEQPLYNANGQFVGYTMKRFANSVTLAEYDVDTFPKLIPNLTKEHQITMALSLCELVRFCHQNCIILCDINLSNVMFDSQQSAYLIDLDSAQICPDNNCFYPSNVGIKKNLPPERIDTNDNSFVRAKADDVWILQLLLFYILTPCGYPYCFIQYDKVTDHEKDPIKNGMYPFQSPNVPAEDFIRNHHKNWYAFISHLAPDVQDAFWNSFNSNGSNFKPIHRLKAIDWIQIIMNYRMSLDSLIIRDSASALFLPTTFVKSVPSDFVTRNNPSRHKNTTGGTPTVIDIAPPIGSIGWDD